MRLMGWSAIWAIHVTKNSKTGSASSIPRRFQSTRLIGASHPHAVATKVNPRLKLQHI